jgi:hypothetical protein
MYPVSDQQYVPMSAKLSELPMSNGTVLSVLLANELPCSSSFFDLRRIVVDMRNREILLDRPEFEGNNRSRRLLANRLGVPVKGRLLKMAWDACAACNPRGIGAPDNLEARFRPVKPCQQDGIQLLDCTTH